MTTKQTKPTLSKPVAKTLDKVRAGDARKAAVMDRTPRRMGVDLLAEAVLLDLTMHRWTNRRKTNTLPKGRANGKAEERLRTTMKMIKSDAYNELTSYLNETHDWIVARCMPSYIVRGIFLVKTDQVPAFEQRFNEVDRWLDEVGIPNLQADWSRAMDQARDDFEEIADQLGIDTPFDPAEYPRPDDLRRRFGISHSYISFGVPQNLPAEVRRQEEIKIRGKFDAAADEITAALRLMFAKMISHATERLMVGPGEQKKILQSDMFDKFTQFFDTFSARNFTNDTALEDLVGEARSLLTNVRVDDLKRQPNARRAVASQMAAIKTKIDQLVIEAPTRVFDLDDEEE